MEKITGKELAMAVTGDSVRAKFLALPVHVRNFLLLIRDRFVQAAGTPVFDKYELMAYTPQALRLPDMAAVDAVYIALRGKHTFRPSVPEVTETVDAFLGRSSVLVEGHVLESRRVVTKPKPTTPLIEGTGESEARQKFRDTIRGLRGFVDSGNRAPTEKFNESKKG